MFLFLIQALSAGVGFCVGGLIEGKFQIAQKIMLRLRIRRLIGKFMFLLAVVVLVSILTHPILRMIESETITEVGIGIILGVVLGFFMPVTFRKDAP